MRKSTTTTPTIFMFENQYSDAYFIKYGIREPLTVIQAIRVI